MDTELAKARIEELLNGEFRDDPEWWGDAEAIAAQMPETLAETWQSMETPAWRAGFRLGCRIAGWIDPARH